MAGGPLASTQPLHSGLRVLPKLAAWPGQRPVLLVAIFAG